MQSRYASACTGLLLIVIFSVLNGVLCVTGMNLYFLFTACVPYFIVDLAMFLCGKYPIEYYGVDVDSLNFQNDGVFVFLLSIAALIVLVYFVCWLKAKQGKVNWMIFAMVFMIVDTVLMFVLGNITADSIMDILFHAWIIASLASGVSAFKKLKKIAEEERRQQPQPVDPAYPQYNDPNVPQQNNNSGFNY